MLTKSALSSVQTHPLGIFLDQWFSTMVFCLVIAAIFKRQIQYLVQTLMSGGCAHWTLPKAINLNL
jgi:hypothetical protein